MNNFSKIQSLISEQLGIPAEKITAESALVDDLKADSLDIMELVMDIEDNYKVTIPDEVLPTIRTVGDIVACLDKLNG